MKILLVAGPYISLREPYNGGTEVFIIEHANQLVRLGHSVDVIAEDTDEKNLFQLIVFNESPLSMKDNSFRSCDEQTGQRHYQTLQFRMLDISSYDLVHYNSFIPEIFAIGALLKIPSVLTLHLPPLEKFSLMYQFFLKHSKVVPVAISSRSSDKWKSILDTNIRVILNGIAMNKWKVQPRKKEGYLLWSGRIAKEKNVKAAIRVASYLEHKLKIVGPIFDTVYFNINVQPYLNEDIEYIPHTTQQGLMELAKGASVYLATASWEEPFGLSTLEMLASGLPVVGYNTAIPPELRHNKVALAVDSNNWEDLIELIPVAKKSSPDSCRAFAALFDIQYMTSSYEKLYDEITNTKIV